MNSKIKLALLTEKYQEKGFTTVLALGVGLIAMAVGMTMIARGEVSKISSYSQVTRAKAEAITEAGITRTTANLQKARGLLTKNYDPNNKLGTGSPNQWSTEKIPPASNSCNSTPQNALNIVPLSGSFTGVSDASSYNVLAYRYDNSTTPAKGTLLVEGQVGNTNPVKTHLEVSFNVTMIPSPTPTLASVMANNINIQQSDVTGNITCTNPKLCPLSCSTGASSPTSAQLKAAIGASSGNAVLTSLNGGSSVINVASIDIPPIPPVPSGATVHSLGNITSNKTLNLSNTTTNTSTSTYGKSSDGNYYFQIGNIVSSAVTISNMPTSASFKVIFYVSGNIDQQGNNDIKPSSGSPQAGQIRIYGGFSNGTMPSSQQFLLSGNACVMAFIHAPKAAVGIKGGGNGCSTLSGSANGTNIYGGVWANSYNVIGNPSNSSIFYEQPGLMTVLAGENSSAAQIPTISGLIGWRRKLIN